MGIFPASLLALIFVLTTTIQVTAIPSSSSTYFLGDDITEFIPACAQSCFVSFLAANFPVSTCSTSPTLDCLCTHKSASGFTAGEGVLQCIIAEENVGFCEGSGGSSPAAQRGYDMCVGKANALPNTHTLLQATIVVDTGTTVVAATTHSSSEASSTSRATADSNTPVTSTPPETTSDTPSTSESDLISPTAPASAQDSSTSAVPGTKLSSPQLAGIVVASVGAAVLAIVAVAIAACMRRRRRKQRERTSDTNSIPFQTGPLNDKKDFPGGPTGGNWGARTIAPPVPKRTSPTDPNMFSRFSVQPDQIGMAVSLETKQANRSSRLLPEKPALRLYVPPAPISKNGPPPATFPMSQSKDESYDYGAPSRDSSMTQFEEDYTPYTPYNYEADTALYVRPNVVVQTAAPVTPPRAGGFQNATQSQEIRRPPARSFSQPLQPNTATSSVYSGRSSPRDSTSNYQNSRSQQQSPYRAYTPYKPTPQQQVSELPTDYNNQGSWPTGNNLVPAPLRRKSHIKDRHSTDLSPVVESPVSYPKIPKLSPTFPYPPPKQPDFQRQQDPQPWRQGEMGTTEQSTSYGLAPSAQIINRESGMSTGSASSSLLEKRRGKEQADALTLKGPSDKPSPRKNGWRVVPNSGGNAADPGWKPQIGGRSFMNMQAERGQVPMSPSPWELTPKKMGDDLFLTVR